MSDKIGRSGVRRRTLLALAAASVSVAVVAISAAGDPQADGLARLKAGNARFVADASEALPITAPRRAALAQGQAPFASVLSCADSRVPPEVIFHTGLGDLFVVRSAGHVADRSVLASLEYGAEHLRIPLLVVMGHEMCGAVQAASDTSAHASLGPNLDYLLNAIRPAVARAASQPAETRLRAAILEHVEETINSLLETSGRLRQLADTQRLMIAGAYYELASGRVHFSEPVRVPPRLNRPAAAPRSDAAGPLPTPKASPTSPAPQPAPASAKPAVPPPMTKPAAAPSATAKPTAPSANTH